LFSIFSSAQIHRIQNVVQGTPTQICELRNDFNHDAICKLYGITQVEENVASTDALVEAVVSRIALKRMKK
jgi:Kinase binding protein CGI-121